jgi:hypothetical protein
MGSTKEAFRTMINALPELLLDKFIKRCKEKNMSIIEAAIEAFRDWIDKE